MNTELWPGGPGAYEIHTAGDHRCLGRVRVEGALARIEVNDGAGLEGIETGPYASTEDAMKAIGKQTRGTCVIGSFES